MNPQFSTCQRQWYESRPVQLVAVNAARGRVSKHVTVIDQLTSAGRRLDFYTT